MTTDQTNILLDKNMYPSKPPMRIEVTLTEARVRQIFREELIKVLDVYSNILDRGDVWVDGNGDVWRRKLTPQEAVSALNDKLKHKE